MKTLWFFKQKTKQRKINCLDNRIASIQRKYASYQTHGRSTKNLTRLLKQLSDKRHRLAIQYDHELTKQIIRVVQQLTQDYHLYVVLGRLKGIRQTRKKGDGASRQHRRELHRWAFARITTMLEYKLVRIGFLVENFRVVTEAWTSRTCSQCGSRTTFRPTQGLFLCRTCGLQLNADLNGARNLGIKLIKSLDGTSPDQWLIKPFVRKGGEVGWKISSLTSRPQSGDDTPSPVDFSPENQGVEPANRKNIMKSMVL